MASAMFQFQETLQQSKRVAVSKLDSILTWDKRMKYKFIVRDTCIVEICAPTTWC